jgi:hypothetical protein
VTHETDRKLQADRLTATDPAIAVREALLNDLKDSNRQLADQITETLRRIGCRLHPVEGRQAQPVVFTEEEEETLAMLVNRRWDADPKGRLDLRTCPGAPPSLEGSRAHD